MTIADRNDAQPQAVRCSSGQPPGADAAEKCHTETYLVVGRQQRRVLT